MEALTKNSTVDSSLSQWVGPGEAVLDEPNPPPRKDDEQIPFDQFPWSDRLVQVKPTVDIGPGLVPDYGYMNPINEYFLYFPLFRHTAEKYTFVNWDSIEVTLTLSAPKSIVGAVMVSWFPYVDFFDESPVGTVDVYLDNSLNHNFYTFINSSNSQIMVYGQASTATMIIPWSFKEAMLPIEHIYQENDVSPQSARPNHGWPICVFKQMVASYISTVEMPATLRWFVKIKGLRLAGPTAGEISPLRIEAQSGLEPLGAVALAAATEAGLSYITDAVVGAANTASPSVTDNVIEGSFEYPQSVQMSYFGDTSSVGFPETKPLLNAGMQKPENPSDWKVHDFLKRPQFVGLANNVGSPGDIHVHPFHLGTTASAVTGSNYFGFFGLLNQFWRGTLIYDFLILGHDFVECSFRVRVDFPHTFPGAEWTMQESPIHQTLFSGTKRVTVPVPYASPRDYQPIVSDHSTPQHENDQYVRILPELTVVSTMLDVEPEISFLIFVRAGPDFKFYQPYPPGLYNVRYDTGLSERGKVKNEAISRGKTSSTVVKPKKKKITSLSIEPQVLIPLENEAEIMTSSLAAVTPDPGILASFDSIYDYMKIWSRSIPFLDYDNEGDEEPIPDPNVGFMSPSWFTPVDRARTKEADSSWFFTLDYIAYLSSMFLFWRGSMGFKLVLSPERDVPDTYLYASLSYGPYQIKARSPWDSGTTDLSTDSNFGAGAVATPATLQPILELSVPYRGYTVWGHTFPTAYTRGISTHWDLVPLGVNSNLQLKNTENVLADAMYRKIDSDFALCFESVLPPYAFWRHRGNDSTIPPASRK